ncbi:response regulator [Zoogloea sp.]|uniref:response regulator transcription factor n=1 Tax=Zoogloea sp. TaxID=49181 RepID=UPI0037D9BF94
MKARILIADDHSVVRQGLRDMLLSCGDMLVVGEAADGLTAERLTESLAPDLLILDVALPERRGVEVLESLRARGIRTPVMFFSMYPASQYANYVRRAGGQGFINKDADVATIIDGLRRVLAGGTAFLSQGHAPAPADGPFAGLSGREAEVLAGLLVGTPASEIALRLGISAKSVSTYRRRILDKIGVDSNAELIAMAVRHGLP